MLLTLKGFLPTQIANWLQLGGLTVIEHVVLSVLVFEWFGTLRAIELQVFEDSHDDPVDVLVACPNIAVWALVPLHETCAMP